MQDNHIKFCDKYFETLNGTKSAIYAGFSEDTAKQQAWQILQREDVQEYLQALRESEAIKHGITKDKWLNELSESGFSNIQDFISEGNTVKDFSQINRSKASAINSVKKTVTEGDFGVKEVTEFKLNDKLSALEKIGKHFGWFEKDNSQKKDQSSVTIFQLPDNGRK